MGLSGRRAGREAAAKMGGSQQGSRSGTPNLEGKDMDDEEEGEGKGGGVRKKLLKKGLKEKVKKGGGVLKSLSVKGAASAGGSSPVRAMEGKREREDGGEDGEEEEGHTKKRQKLQRVGSTTSIVSQSTAAPDMERSESQDGSLIDASFADD